MSNELPDVSTIRGLLRITEEPSERIAVKPAGYDLAQHILALETDPYLQGHPEWEAFLNEAQALVQKTRWKEGEPWTPETARRRIGGTVGT